MSSKPKETTQTTQQESRTGPLAAAEPYFLDLYRRGSEAVGETSGRTFGGPFIAGPTEAQRQGVSLLLGAAPNLAAGATDLQGIGQRIASGEFLDLSNPVFTGAVEATINPIQQRVMEDLLPAITDQAIAQGAFGGSEQALQNERVLEDFTRAAGDVTSRMGLNYLNARFGDLAMAPGLIGAGAEQLLAPGQVTSQAGALEQSLDQIAIDNALMQFQEEQAAPFYGLQEFANLLTTGGFREGSSEATRTVTQPAPDMNTQILQGLAGAAGIAGSLMGIPGVGALAGSMFGPTGNSMLPFGVGPQAGSQVLPWLG